MEKKPYMGKAKVPDTPKKEPIAADTGAGDPKEVEKTKKKFSDVSKEIQSLKKDQGKAKQAVVDLDTDKFFSDVEKRKQSGFDNLRKAVQTGKTKSGEDAAKIGREGTRDISTMNPSERQRAFGGSGSTEGGAGVEGPKNQSGVVKFSSGARGQFPSGSAETGGEMKKFASRNRTPVKSFNQFKSEIPVYDGEVVKTTPFDNQKIEPKKPKKQKPTITRSRKRVDKGFQSPRTDIVKSKEKSIVSQDEIQGPFKKAREFARREPVLGIAAYDLGKGILSKIMKTRIPNVPTPRAIRVSAKS